MFYIIIEDAEKRTIEGNNQDTNTIDTTEDYIDPEPGKRSLCWQNKNLEENTYFQTGAFVTDFAIFVQHIGCSFLPIL